MWSLVLVLCLPYIINCHDEGGCPLIIDWRGSYVNITLKISPGSSLDHINYILDIDSSDEGFKDVCINHIDMAVDVFISGDFNDGLEPLRMKAESLVQPRPRSARWLGISVMANTLYNTYCESRSSNLKCSLTLPSQWCSNYEVASCSNLKVPLHQWIIIILWSSISCSSQNTVDHHYIGRVVDVRSKCIVHDGTAHRPLWAQPELWSEAFGSKNLKLSVQLLEIWSLQNLRKNRDLWVW